MFKIEIYTDTPDNTKEMLEFYIKALFNGEFINIKSLTITEIPEPRDLGLKIVNNANMIPLPFK